MSNELNDDAAPLLAPHWTRAGYNGRLKDAVEKACREGVEEEGGEEEGGEKEGGEEEEGEEKGKEVEDIENEMVEETVLLTSNDQQISSDDNLEMDD